MKTWILFTFYLFLILTSTEFQIQAQGWEVLSSLENPSNLPVLSSANGKIYLLSGTSGPNAKTYEYDPSTNTWSEKAPIPEGCFWATAVTVDGKIYVMGGGQPSYSQRKDYNFIYNPIEDKWTEGSALLDPRLYHSAAAANGKIYLIGGQNGDNSTEKYFDEYDTKNDSWERKSQLLNNQAWYCGAVTVGNYFYRIAGGSWNHPTDYFEQYNTLTDTWTELAPCPVSIHAPAVFNYYNKIIVMGGYNNEQKTDNIYIYYPETDFWTLSFNKLPEPMAYHKATVLDGYVYIYNKEESGQYGHLWRYKFSYLDVGDKINDNQSEIEIYPNPNNGNFTIDYRGIKNSNMTINVFNVLCKKVYTRLQTAPVEKVKINLENKIKGIYFIQINLDNEIVMKKVIIN